MQIPKETIVNLVRERLGGEKAEQADRELPETVDPDQHGDVLSRFGIEPKDLIGGLGGKLGL
jgi:hypothetical protein